MTVLAGIAMGLADKLLTQMATLEGQVSIQYKQR